MTKNVIGAAAHLGIDLREYDARIRTFIPDYDTMLRIAAFSVQLTVRKRTPLVVDLGIGTGALSAAVLERIPGARIVGVDEDEAMLAAAGSRLGSKLVRSLPGSFERIAIPRCDAVIASLSLHHIPTRARRLRLFRRIHRVLRPGGVLIVADCYPESSVRLAAFDRLAWLAHLEESYPPQMSRNFLRAWAREDHYAVLTDEIATLQRAGFTVDIPGRKQAFAVVVATKSGALQ